jgi:iron complex outermembrane receptor protein
LGKEGKTVKQPLLCIILLQTIAGNAVSETPKSLSANPEREIVSTATRYPEPRSGISAYTTVVTESEIRNSPASNLPDLLRNIAGVQVSDRGGNRKFYLVDLRSFGTTAGQSTLILVDGRRVNATDSTGSDWTNILLERVKRIEVIRGGRGAVLFGDNTDGGIINIITENRFGPPSPPGFTLGIGSYDTKKGSISINGASKNSSFEIFGNMLTSGGYRENGAVESRDFGINARYAISGAGGISFWSGFHQDKTGSPGPLTEVDLSGGKDRSSSSTPDDYTDATDYYFHTRPELALSDKLYASTDISFRKRDSATFTAETEPIIKTERIADTFIFSPQLLLKIPGKGYSNRLLAGWDYRDTQEWIKRSFDTTTESYNFARNLSGYYIHDDLILAERISVSAGLRREKTDSTFYPLAVERTAASAESKTAGINYNYGDGSNVYMNWSNGFRFPFGDERYDLEESVDTSLKMQDSNSTELGFKRQTAPEAFYTLNLFRLEIQNEIVSSPLSNAAVNLDGTTKREGIEFSYTVDPGPYLATLNWVYRTATIESGSYKGKNIPGCAENIGSFNIALRLGDGMILAFTGNYTGERYLYGDFENSFGKQDPFTVYNARIAQKIDKLSAFIEINNLNDSQYSEYGALAGASQEEVYHPSQGRSYRLGITLEL